MKKQKPLSLGRRGSCKNAIGIILQHSCRIAQLKNHIQHHRLTESLNILEKLGYTGDLAIFIIANVQSLGVSG